MFRRPSRLRPNGGFHQSRPSIAAVIDLFYIGLAGEKESLPVWRDFVGGPPGIADNKQRSRRRVLSWLSEYYFSSHRFIPRGHVEQFFSVPPRSQLKTAFDAYSLLLGCFQEPDITS